MMKAGFRSRFFCSISGIIDTSTLSEGSILYSFEGLTTISYSLHYPNLVAINRMTVKRRMQAIGKLKTIFRYAIRYNTMKLWLRLMKPGTI